MERSNPFKFGEAVSGEYFSDREDEMKRLLLDLSSCQNVILYSARRYGKTSLILNVISQLRKSGFLCIYVDLFPASSKTRFAEILATAISREASTKMEKIGNLLGELLPAIKPKIVLKEQGMDFEIELGGRDVDIDRTLDDLYDAPARIAKKRKMKVIVVFDEFQEIANIDGEVVERNMRSKIQHHEDVGYVFLGSKRHLMDSIFNNKSRAFYKIGKFFSLGKIPREKFASFIKRRFKSTGIEIKQELCDEILRISGCHPYYTQMLCHETWNESTKKVSKSSIERALNSVISSQSYAFTTIWESLSSKQKNLLIALTRGETELHSQSIIAGYELGSSATVSKSLKTLETKEILERDNGAYAFIDPFFKEWIKLRIK